MHYFVSELNAWKYMDSGKNANTGKCIFRTTTYNSKHQCNKTELKYYILDMYCAF